MIVTRLIDQAHAADINLKNEPFPLTGRMIPALKNGQWSYQIQKFSPAKIKWQTFPNENYNYNAMQKNSLFIGAYDTKTDQCVGLAILQKAYFKYLYLYDLKVRAAYRGHGCGLKLINTCFKIAKERGYAGLYTQGQDNNLEACLFYLRTGFIIGGFDNHVYQGTKQAGKADIIFYKDK